MRVKYTKARDEYNKASDEIDKAWVKFEKVQTECQPKIDALFAAECPDVAWDDNRLVFPKE
jgi:hypothetical protein